MKKEERKDSEKNERDAESKRQREQLPAGIAVEPKLHATVTGW
jgi:hypothetical protein